MGTRSTIALEFADGTVQQVYCHWDGYLEHNGAMLAQHYLDPFKVKQLLALGGFSSLEASVEDTKKTAYAFSRGEELIIQKYKNVDEYFAECQQEEYDYILRPVNGIAVWFVRCYATDGAWVTMNQAEELISLATEDEDY
jgi:hypothetical protein